MLIGEIKEKIVPEVCICMHCVRTIKIFLISLVLRWNNLENLSNVLYMGNSRKQALINTECFQSERLTLMESDAGNLTEATCKSI